ncbi:Putative phospholipid-transporting ATPase C24B11.12c [Psilocybe cubensis]|uniref:Phospholipid-transporting ATPase n=2 Tax=Psilocybe cubensis TaxID=181762 RepID=A0A8H7XNI8_PSICU|nr:Putative phospholipid-transporting ATPase C24B11.12c [Psilocybe cubensis]KAH9476290.1 Putative phospholipid-transporting ATPase C24B11.12c [Psilocybe cubensis]
MSLFKRNQVVDEPDTDEENDETIDPELRLRTVRTAASAIAESIRSEQRTERRKSRRFFRRHTAEKKQHQQLAAPPEVAPTAAPKVPGARRNVYVNHPLSAMEVDAEGEPKARYVRNKVRTTKYTLITFIPKNLYEQFRRVANLFFLSLVILQLFPIFGAAAGSIAVLPLAFILTVTAIKDGIEDYRRGTLDEEVNTSAATKLGGGFRNVNQPRDPRNWLEKLLGLNAPGKVTKGVRKLRDREAGAAGQDIRVILNKGGDDSSSVLTHDVSQSSVDLTRGARGAGGRRLEDIQSVDSHSYPPATLNDLSKTSLSEGSINLPKGTPEWSQFGSLANYQQSVHSQSNIGVIDWRKRTSGSSRWERTLWKKLEVGDIVLLRDNDQVPADIVVLSTSDPENMCYLETKNLDGETNLKPRKSVRATSSISSEDDVDRSSFYLDSEPPHQNLYHYHAVLRYTDPATGEKKQEPVSINELLLRGCAIRNTAWIIGLVVFTGGDTKIMLNGGETPSKRSKIEKETNFNVIVNFVVLTLMCLIAAIFSGLEDAKTGTSSQFYEIDTDPTSSLIVNAVITFVSCLIAFQNIVPISLYISIEIVKTIQAYFISQDVEMYYKPYDTPCVPKTWNISDDLGQIEYVFSDKTGTLTQNIMEFQKCSVHGVTYGEGITEAQRGAATREGKGDTLNPDEINAKLEKLKTQMVNTMARAFKNRYMQVDKLTLVSPKFADDLIDRSGEQRTHMIAFFRALALCHSVLADKPEPQASPFLINYKAESPDEAALVSAARDAGFPFLGKSKDTLEIEVMGQSEKYTLLKLLEFNSTRKRMSVVLRCPDGKLIMYCKGADSVIYERLAKDHDPELKERTSKDMEMFANNGLRTLCISYRYLEEEEYMNWSRIYDLATNAIENREEEIDKANALIEHSLTILGATALEDKLQEGVPEAIEMLHRAGIKLWILTGDKLQTAIEIGYSCNLLKNDMDLMILSAATLEQTRAQLEAGLNKIASVLGPPTWDLRRRGFVPGAQASFAVVIDGDTLRHALTPELKPLFLNLGTQCETVVCCRVSPAQKALTVKLVKEGRNAMTLSIGDGANDVAMIQEANIGCGLFGLEGSQAAMSADYAFGQFRFLTKLLLVHGRWSYQRIADMHSNFFYKNVVWTFAMFWYLPFNSFNATYLYHYTFVLLCNLVFTSLPVIVLGAFDQDINAKAALAFPQLYVRGIRGLEYTRTKFWMYMTDGLYQSAVVYFFPYFVWTIGLPISWNGKGVDSLADFGTTVAVAAIMSANAYVGLNTHYWTIMTFIVVIGSTLVMLLWIVIYSFFPSADFVDEVTILFSTIYFWASVFLATTVCLAPRFIVKYWSTVYQPLDKDIVREMWVKGDLKDQLGLSHRKNRKQKSPQNLEAAPMFTEQHARSLSEISSIHNVYEPAHLSSPAPNATPRQTYLDTPPMNENLELPPREPGVQYAQVRNQPVSDTHLSPLPLGARFDNTPSPQPSYYSASDLPPASPLPSPKYRYPNGEITSTPPSRRTSLATSRAASVSARGAPQSPMPTAPLPPQPHSPNALLVPGSPYGPGQMTDAAQYEMQVRSGQQQQYQHNQPYSAASVVPPSPYGSVNLAQSEISHATYATAADDFYDAQEDVRGTNLGYLTPEQDVYGSQQAQPMAYSPQYGSNHPQPQQQQYQQHQHLQPAVLDVDEINDGDGSTLRHHRPVSAVSNASTWEGGRAL